VYKVKPDIFVIPPIGKSWKMVMAENTGQLQRDRFNYDKTKDQYEAQTKGWSEKMKVLQDKADAAQTVFEAAEKRVNEAVDAYNKEWAGEKSDATLRSLKAVADQVKAERDAAKVAVTAAEDEMTKWGDSAPKFVAPADSGGGFTPMEGDIRQVPTDGKTTLPPAKAGGKTQRPAPSRNQKKPPQKTATTAGKSVKVGNKSVPYKKVK
jgi:hypothetical protein